MSTTELTIVANTLRVGTHLLERLE